MSLSKEKVGDAIDKYLDENIKASEHNIIDFIGKFDKEQNDEGNKWIQYELMAFSFSLPEGGFSDWGTSYGPVMRFKKEDGLWYESPSLEAVTSDHLDYWLERSKKVKHPLAKIRYSDITWDLAPKIDKRFRLYDLAVTVVDSTLDYILNDLYANEIDGIGKLRRALSLALSLSDKDRTRQTARAIIKFENKIAIDKMLGLWGFSYDLLLANGKVEISDEDELKIIQDLESRLERTRTKSENYSPHAVEACANRLIGYYHRKGNPSSLREVLLKFGNCVIDFSKYNPGMISAHWLEKIYDLYRSYGLTDEINKISALLSEANKKILEEMKPISHTIEIPKEEMEQFINEVLGNNLEVCLQNIERAFIPILDQLKDQIKRNAEISPLQSFLSVNLQADDGRTVAKIGSIEDDLDGRIVQAMDQNLSIAYIWLSQSIIEMKKKYKPQSAQLVDYLYQSPLFPEDRRGILLRAMEAYLPGDYLLFSHFVIPQIENSLRILLRLNGENTYKPNRKGGYNLVNLNDILRSQIVLDIFGADIVTYFKVLLSDERGWNLRNLLAHGMINPDALTAYSGDRLFHTLLILSQVRLKEKL